MSGSDNRQRGFGETKSDNVPLWPPAVHDRSRSLEWKQAYESARRKFVNHVWWFSPDKARLLADELRRRADEAEQSNVPIVGMSVTTLNEYTTPRRTDQRP